MTKPESKQPSWSFSSLKMFQTCPKQYYHIRVRKEHPVVETEAIQYGTRFHKAAEEYIRDGKPLPQEFGWSADTLDALNAMKGTKHCELQFALDANLAPCEFMAKDVWWRGIADLLILNGDKATVIDYKTGSSARYADTGQLELMAMAVFKHHPEVQSVRAGLLFVLAKAFPKAAYQRADESKLWGKWLKEYSRMQSAYDNDVWNPKPSGLCKRHCPVLECPHNGRS